MTAAAQDTHPRNVPPTEARFWDKIAPRYAKRPVPDEQAYEQTLDRVRARLQGNESVLEIGCGTGTTALKLADAAGRIEATDVSEGMIRIARTKVQAQGIDNVHFEVGTLESPSLEGRRFDVVTAFNVLHLLADVPTALRRIHHLLEPGGWFISKTPCVGEMGIWVRGVIPVMQFFGRAPFVNYVTLAGLEEDVRGAGFEVVETDLFPKKSDSLYIAARRLD